MGVKPDIQWQWGVTRHNGLKPDIGLSQTHNRQNQTWAGRTIGKTRHGLTPDIGRNQTQWVIWNDLKILYRYSNFK